MNEYKIKFATPSGGKAGKGHNKTSTIQVIRDSMIIKMFRFTVNNPESMRKARIKAEEFVASQSKGST